MGRSRRATHTGRGIKIVSTKQDVGIGEEILECGPCFRCQFIRSLVHGETTYEALGAVGTKHL